MNDSVLSQLPSAGDVSDEIYRLARRGRLLRSLHRVLCAVEDSPGNDSESLTAGADLDQHLNVIFEELRRRGMRLAIGDSMMSPPYEGKASACGQKPGLAALAAKTSAAKTIKVAGGEQEAERW